MLRSAGLVGLMTLISRITGMFQSIVLAHYLGAGAAADAWFVAFRLPNLLRRFTAEGTMTAAFLPTVSETEASQGEAAAKDLVAKFLGTLALFMVVLCALGVLAMGLVAGLQNLGRLAPGLRWYQQLPALVEILRGLRPTPPELALTTLLARWMFPYLGLVSLTAGLTAVLNLKGRFGLPASVSTFWNLAFIGVVVGSMKLGPAAWRDPGRTALVCSIAVIVGGIVQLFVLWPSFHGLGYRLRWGLHLGHAGVRTALKRMAPGLIGTGIHPINVFISTILASQLAEGAQTVLFQSNMMGELILGLFAASVATVSLPAMSRLVDAGDLDGLRDSLASAVRGTAVLAIPGSVGMAVLAHPIISVIFRTGRFDAHAVQWTATTLAFQAVGLLFIATGRITAQCLYALKDYRTPAYAALGSMATNVTFSILLMGPLDTGGIALANSFSSMVGLGLMLLSLQQRLGRVPYRRVGTGWLWMGLSAALMGLLAFFGGKATGLFAPHGRLGISVRLFPLIAVASGAYFGLLFLFQVDEARSLLALAKRKLARR
jgi:putative peptidoglycan lipid II flippase